MAYFEGDLCYHPGDRLYDSVWQLVQLVATVCVAQISNFEGKLTQDFSFTQLSLVHKTGVTFPVANIIPISMSNLKPISITVTVDTKPYIGIMKNGGEKEETKMAQWVELHMLCISVIFVNFWEKNLTEVRKKWKDDAKTWPQIVNFTRAMRNAVSHSGNLHFKGESSIKWHHIVYTSKADNGRKVIGETMRFAEMFLLMTEFSAHLDNADVPIVT